MDRRQRPPFFLLSFLLYSIFLFSMFFYLSLSSFFPVSFNCFAMLSRGFARSQSALFTGTKLYPRWMHAKSGYMNVRRVRILVEHEWKQDTDYGGTCKKNACKVVTNLEHKFKRKIKRLCMCRRYMEAYTTSVGREITFRVVTDSGWIDDETANYTQWMNSKDDLISILTPLSLGYFFQSLFFFWLMICLGQKW